jgi:hypothetical protein
MKFCPVVSEICHGQVHVPKKGNSVFSKFSKCLPFSKWLPKHGIKNGQ